MTGIVWLASYPKSGNTWMRLLIANLDGEAEAPTDINALSKRRGIASSRELLDELTLLESGLLTDEEVDLLRPAVYCAWAAEIAGRDGGARQRAQPLPPRHFIKSHDAYTRLSDDRPLLGGAEAARGAIVIVRDPRDIAPSLADHRGCSIDEAIDLMSDPEAAQARSSRGQNRQLRQRLLDWSSHVSSWLDQNDIPVCPVRYESMLADAAGMLTRAMAFAGCPTTAEQVARAVRLSAFEALRRQEEAKGFAEARVGRRFFRRGEAGGWRAALSKDQVARIEGLHGPTMARLGYATTV
ncbi:MAG TPA: sulfotransferase domain-containing protein [Allosphingosinicella sp.]